MNEKIILQKTENFCLSGNLNNYAAAEPISLLNAVTGEKPKLSTTLYALKSADFMYFAFLCEDDYAVANMTKYNDKLYNEDVTEVFIAAEGNRGKYIELEVSPGGALFCGLIHNSLKKSRRLKLFPRAIATCHARQTERGYLTEIKISISTIKGKLNIRNAVGLVGNCYRIDRPNGSPWELSAVNPTGKEAFHVPEQFIPII